MFIKREALADTFALISFALVVGMSIEVFIAGLSLAQSMQSRLLSIPVNILIARPYGLFRDWVMVYGKAEQGGLFRSAALDSLAYIGFQMPIYALLVVSTGASMEQVMTACLGQAGAFVIMGRPYGLYLQLCRNWFAGGSGLRTA